MFSHLAALPVTCASAFNAVEGAQSYINWQLYKKVHKSFQNTRMIFWLRFSEEWNVDGSLRIHRVSLRISSIFAGSPVAGLKSSRSPRYMNIFFDRNFPFLIWMKIGKENKAFFWSSRRQTSCRSTWAQLFIHSGTSSVSNIHSSQSAASQKGLDLSVFISCLSDFTLKTCLVQAKPKTQCKWFNCTATRSHCMSMRQNSHV